MIKKRVLAATIYAVLLGGCASNSYQEEYSSHQQRQNMFSAELNFQAENNRQREQIFLLNKQLGHLESQLKRINDQKAKLEQEITLAQYQSEDLSGTSEAKEVSQIEAFQKAVGASQSRVAEYEAKLELVTAEIEGGLDAQIASIETNTSRLIADLESQKKLKIAKLRNQKRAELARVRAKAKMDAALVVAPVMADSGVHTDTVATPTSADTRNAPVVAKPVQMRKAGTLQPTIQRAKTRDVFDVMYIFKSRSSWKHFNKFLSAYGVKDKFGIPNKSMGEFITYVGRYNNHNDAKRRKEQLARMTHTDHAIIRKKSIRL